MKLSSPHFITLFLVLFSMQSFAYTVNSDYFLIGDFAYDASEYGGAKDSFLAISTDTQFCKINASDGSEINCVSRPSAGNPFIYLDNPPDPADDDPYGGKGEFIYLGSDYHFYGVNATTGNYDWEGAYTADIDSEAYSMIAIDSQKDLLFYDISLEKVLEYRPRSENTTDGVPTTERVSLPASTYGIINSMVSRAGTTWCFIAGEKNGQPYVARYGSDCNSEENICYPGFGNPHIVQVDSGNIESSGDGIALFSDNNVLNRHSLSIPFHTGSWGHIEVDVQDIVGSKSTAIEKVSNNIKVAELDGDDKGEVLVSVAGSSGKALLFFDYSSTLQFSKYYFLDQPDVLFGINSTTLRDAVDLNSYGEDEIILTHQSSRWNIERFAILGLDDTVSITPVVTSSNTKRRQDTTRDSVVGGYAYSELPLNLSNQGTLPVRKVQITYNSSGSDLGDSINFGEEVQDLLIPSLGTTIYTIRYSDDDSLRRNLPAQYSSWTDSGESVAGGDALIRTDIQITNSDTVEYNATYNFTGANDIWCKGGWGLDHVNSGFISVPQGGATTTNDPVYCNKSGVLPTSGSGWGQDTSRSTLAGGNTYIVGDATVQNNAEVSLNISVGQPTADSAGRAGWACIANTTNPGIESLGSSQEDTIHAAVFCNKNNVIDASGDQWYQVNTGFLAGGNVTIRGRLNVTNTDTFDYYNIKYNSSTQVRSGWNCEMDEEGIIDVLFSTESKTTPDYSVNCTGTPVQKIVGNRTQDNSEQAELGKEVVSVLNVTIENNDDLSYSNVNWSFNASWYENFTIYGYTSGTLDLSAHSYSARFIYFSADVFSMDEYYENSIEGYTLNFTLKNNDSISYDSIRVPIEVNQTRLNGAPLEVRVFWNGSWDDITPETECDSGMDSFANGFSSCLEDTTEDGFFDIYVVIQPNSTDTKYSLTAPEFKYIAIQEMELQSGDLSYCSLNVTNISGSKSYSLSAEGKGFLYVRKADTSEFELKVNGKSKGTLEKVTGGNDCDFRTYRIKVTEPSQVNLIGNGYVDFVGFQIDGTTSLYSEDTYIVMEGFSIDPSDPNMSIDSSDLQMEKIYMPDNSFSNFYYFLYLTNNTSHNVSTELKFDGWSDASDFEIDSDFPVIDDLTYSGFDVISNFQFSIDLNVTESNLLRTYVRYNNNEIDLNNSSGNFTLNDLGVISGNVTLQIGAEDTLMHITEENISLRVSEFSEEIFFFPRIVAMHIFAGTSPVTHAWSSFIFISHIITGTARNISLSEEFSVGEPWTIENVSGVVNYTEDGNTLTLNTRNYSGNDSEGIMITYNISEAFDIVYNKVSADEAYVLIDNASVNSDYHSIPNVFVTTSLPRHANLSEERVVLSFCDILNPNDPFDCIESWTTYENPFELPILMKNHVDGFTKKTDCIEFRISRTTGTLVRITFDSNPVSPPTSQYIYIENILKDYNIELINSSWNASSVKVGQSYDINFSFYLANGTEGYFHGFSVPNGTDVEGFLPEQGIANFSEPLLIDEGLGPIGAELYEVKGLSTTLIAETYSGYVKNGNTYTATRLIEVYDDLVSNGSIIYEIFTTGFPNFADRLADPQIWVDGRQGNLSWELLGGDNILRIIVGENFGNSSLHEGEHNVTIEYGTDEGGDDGSPSGPSGGSPGGGGRVKVPMKANISWDSPVIYRGETGTVTIYFDNMEGYRSQYTFNYSCNLEVFSQTQSITLNSGELGIIRFLIQANNSSPDTEMFYLDILETHLDMQGYALMTLNISLTIDDKKEEVGGVIVANESKNNNNTQISPVSNLTANNSSSELPTIEPNDTQKQSMISGFLTLLADISPFSLGAGGVLAGGYILYSTFKTPVPNPHHSSSPIPLPLQGPIADIPKPAKKKPKKKKSEKEEKKLEKPVKEERKAQKSKPKQEMKEPEEKIAQKQGKTSEKLKKKKFGIKDSTLSEFGSTDELKAAEEELKKYFVAEK